MRVLTRVEYNNTVLDLLGDATRPADAFPAESAADTGFAEVQRLDDVNVGAYLTAADGLAGRAVARGKAFLGCEPVGAGEDACVRSFVTAFGRRAYRRPLTGAEVDEHMTFYRGALRTTQAMPTNEALATLVTGMLQSPFFLYRWELGWDARDAKSGVARLSPHHLASQLSYFLWASMPDDPLFAAADGDQLASPAAIEAQARRMLADKRAERTVASFAEQWLGTTGLSGKLRNRSTYPAWQPALARAMEEELSRFTAEVILRGDARVETLLTTTFSFANGPLAAFYGATAVTGEEFEPSTLPADKRAGLLTLAAVMAAHADENEPSPILRGKFIREHVMCEKIPPPDGMIPELDPPNAAVTKKERFAAHSMGSCQGCHKLMDPIGFGFEHYDAIGAFRTMDGQFAVDSKGTISNLDGVDQPFTNGLELARLLAASPQVAGCVARQVFRYGMARMETKDELTAAMTRFRESKHDVRELLVALVTSPAFTHRTLGTEEVSP
jgi:hypothetical protein